MAGDVPDQLHTIRQMLTLRETEGVGRITAYHFPSSTIMLPESVPGP